MSREGVVFSIYMTYDTDDYPDISKQEFEELVLQAITRNTDLNRGEVRVTAIGVDKPSWVKREDP